MFKRHLFRAKGYPVITKGLIGDLLKSIEAASDKLRTSLDLGITYTYLKYDRLSRTVEIHGNVYKDDELRDMFNLMREDYVYYLEGREVKPVALWTEKYFYKLYPVSPYEAPTLEISGIKMHRIKGITPWMDAKSKVAKLNIKAGEKVLDICTGLGYTAINAHRCGGIVDTIELDDNVLEMASYNPWSRGLERVNVFLGDAYVLIKEIDSDAYDVIIHDPPRFSRAGELYSLEFYRELFRVLRKGGRMYHYCGRVGEKARRLDIVRGVAKRLRSVGFTVKIDRGMVGVYAHKR